jgi:hypothetical protein
MTAARDMDHRVSFFVCKAFPHESLAMLPDEAPCLRPR